MRRGTKKNSVSPIRGHWFDLQANQRVFTKKQTENDRVIDQTWNSCQVANWTGMRSSIGRILHATDPMSSSDPSMSVPNPGQPEESLPKGAHLCSSGYTGDHSLFSNAGSWLRSPTSLPWGTRFWQSTTGTNICCYHWQNVTMQ